MPIEMKRSFNTLLAACSIIASVAGQEDMLDDFFEEEEDLILQDIWPRYDTTEFTSVTQESTNNDNPDYWQEGTFSTVTNIIGD